MGLFVPGAEDETLLLAGSAEGIGREDGRLSLHSANGAILLQQDHVLESQEHAFQRLVPALHAHFPQAVSAVGHRIVHGGPSLRTHQLITPALLSTLESAVHFAPLHIPQALATLRQAEQLFPGIPQFACFDTAFHRTMPERASRLPIPERFAAAGVMRFGFHGLSCEAVMHRLGGSPAARLVIAHLGGGSSVTAVATGVSIDSSMGMSPTGGVPMGTRSGDLDPAVLLFMLRSGLSADKLEQVVNHECGLAGISEDGADMQALLQRADEGDAKALLAVDIFCTGIRKQIGSYAALMGGLDLLVFTGGIGEHSGRVRERIATDLEFLGLGNASSIVAMPTQEEIQIARHCRRLLKAPGAATTPLG